MKDLWVEKFGPNKIEEYVIKDKAQKQQAKIRIAENFIPHLLFSIGLLGRQKFETASKYFMKKIFALMTASFMLVSTSAYAVKESNLATAYSATLWGAGIGVVTGLGLAALNTEDGEKIVQTEDRIRVNVLQGFGSGVLFGLVYGLFEISSFGSGAEVTTHFDPLNDQMMVSYNYKF